MKRFSSTLLCAGVISCLLVSCDENESVDLNQIPLDTKLQRFETAFFRADSNDFEQMIKDLEQDFPPFFASETEAIFWKNQRRDPLQIELFGKITTQFGDLEKFEKNLSEVVKRYYYYFGAEDTLQVYSYISRLDFDYPIVYAKPYLFVGLDLYLGEAGKSFYQTLPEYLQYPRQSAFMLRDIAFSLAREEVPVPEEPVSLLDAMVYYGKVLKITEMLLGEVEQSTLLVFPPVKYDFCLAHEKQMWVYFIENEMLFKSDLDLQRRFIELGPFSKFRTQTDPQTPGRIGWWYGYKIVDAFLQQNDEVDIETLIRENDARKILKLSSYKP